jgi:long-chain acyl-CoA synthetase
MPHQDFTVYDIICRNAHNFADRETIVFNDVRLTHKQFKHNCDQVAAGLIKSGVKQGDRLAVVAHNSDEYMILYGAAAKIGAIVLAINWRYQQDEVEYVLNDCTPRLVFAGPDYHRTLKTALPNCSSIEKCYAIGGGDDSGDLIPFAELYTEDGADEEFDIPADAGFVIIHTAAVAGQPRGALLSQGNVVAANYPTLVIAGLGPDDCHICILPLFHVAGLSLSMVTMHAGGKNVLVERFDPELTLKLIQQEKGTTFFHFAPILSRLLETYDQSNFDLSSLRFMRGMDSADNVKAFCEKAPNLKVGTAFAQTEAMGVTGGLAEERPGSAGKPTIISRVKLFDDYDREVPVGTPGEICVRSPAVFQGYWGRDEDNAYTFRKGWHHTGDIGRFDEDGFLWYVKRKAEKELIKPGGENVYPAEVEKVILEHEAVAEVSVIGVTDPQWGEAIKAVVVLNADMSATTDELSEFVAARIARYKKPKYVDFVDALPKTEDGEIDRDQVKKNHGAKY